MVTRKNSNATAPDRVPGVEKAEPGKEEEDKENADVIELREVETKKPRTSAMNQKTWKEIAIAMDRVFFWVFLTLFVLSSFAIYGQAGRLSSIDTF